MVSQWERQILIIEDSKLYIIFDGQWICIKADGSSELIEDLKYNQEEADNRMLLHAQHMWHLTENIMIHAPETDILIIAIAISTEISGDLCIRMPASYP